MGQDPSPKRKDHPSWYDNSGRHTPRGCTGMGCTGDTYQWGNYAHMANAQSPPVNASHEVEARKNGGKGEEA